MAKIVIVIGIWYHDGFGFSDQDRIMFWAKFSDQDQILLKFFGADRIIKFQNLHNTTPNDIKSSTMFTF